MVNSIADGEAWHEAVDAPALRRGFVVALVLSLLFLVITAYSSAATLLSRVGDNDVMKAASGGVWSGRIAWEMFWFGSAVILMHVMFAALAWLLAVAALRIWPRIAHRFVLAAVGWFALLAAAVLAFNALWYPRTLIGLFYHDAMSATAGPFFVGQVVYGSVLALCVGFLVALGWIEGRRRGFVELTARGMVAPALVLAVALVAAIVWRQGPASASAANDARPNVIILGIDSLRLDQLRRFGGTEGNTPNLDRYLADADLLRDATTPAARTFSSWVAILSGRSPVQTGARFNLADRTSVATNPTIADVLRQVGYRTVYSTDEVRFANIDETYGFDQRITPPIGASDFLIGSYNELPLSTIVINSRVGQYLFPFSYGNRGVATMFQPQTYLGRLDRELQFDRPTLFIAHLTASHWPYYDSSVPLGKLDSKGPDDRPAYRKGLQTADAMFGQMLAMLRRKGALRNAIVIVLSDHGEALRLPNDSFFKSGSLVEGLGAPLKMLDIGHGQSVLSPTQFHVLVSFRSFGQKPAFRASGREFPRPTTVEDIAPTVLDLLGIDRTVLASTGLSAAPLLRGAAAANDADAARVRFTETDLSVLPAADGSIDENATVQANSKFFEINPANGRLQIRQSFAPLALAYKERAAFTPRHLLAAIPAGPDAHQYLYFDLVTGDGQLLLGRPEAGLPEGRLLWDALAQHYAGELRPAVRVTMEDWPVIDQQWKDFFINRRQAKVTGAAGNAPGADEPAGRDSQPVPK